MAGLLSYQMTPQLSSGQFIGDALSGIGQGLLAYGAGGQARQQAGLIGAQGIQDAAARRQEAQYRAQQSQSLTQQLAQQQQQMQMQQQAMQQAGQQREQYKSLLGGQPIQGPTQSGAPLDMKSPVNPLLSSLPTGVQATLPLMSPEQGTSFLASLATQKPAAQPDKIQEYEYAKKNGFQGSMLDYQTAVASASRPPMPTPADIQEYQYAKGQGYNGTYMDYVKAKGVANQPTFSVLTDQSGNPVGQRDNTSGKVEAYPQGPSKAPTAEQAKAGGFHDRMQNSEQIIQNLGTVGTDYWQSKKDQLPFGLNNYAISGQKQQLDQAERDFINAQLRQESGAAISSGEFDSARAQYFPQPGDSSQTIQQKQVNRQIAIDAMKKNAGVAYFNQNNGSPSPATPSANASSSGNSPVPGAKKAPDGNWYLPDPNRPGKYLMVQ